MLVADCAADDGTPEWMAANGILLEVGHETARRWGIVGRGVKVQVIR